MFVSFICLALLTILQAESPGTSFEFTVEHDHFWGQGEGKLSVSAEGITFEEPGEKDHSRRWSFEEIQNLKIESSRKIRLLTYEDSRWMLNRDRGFEFELTQGEITPELVRFLREKLLTPVASAVFAPPAEPFYSLPVKHRHAWGSGCKGELIFGKEGIYYTSSHSEHARLWLFGQIESLGRMSPYDFRLTVREASHAGSTRNFQFQLKRPLDEKVYQELWRKVYEPKSWLVRIY